MEYSQAQIDGITIFIIVVGILAGWVISQFLQKKDDEMDHEQFKADLEIRKRKAAKNNLDDKPKRKIFLDDRILELNEGYKHYNDSPRIKCCSEGDSND